MIHYYLPFAKLRNQKPLSERSLVVASGLSRGTVRQLCGKKDTSKQNLASIAQLADFFQRQVEIFASPTEIHSEYSTLATAYKVQRDGFDSWKTHYFDFVDEFRRTLDVRLLLLPPPRDFDQKPFALLAAIVRDLCLQNEIATPRWAAKCYFLNTPWFVSGIESLKAFAILESPLPYRTNNIFVQSNFLSRH